MKLGNSVGTKPFKNTNRKDAKYTRRLNKKARAHGFSSHKAFVEHLKAIINLQEVKSA